MKGGDNVVVVLGVQRLVEAQLVLEALCARDALVLREHDENGVPWDQVQHHEDDHRHAGDDQCRECEASQHVPEHGQAPTSEARGCALMRAPANGVRYLANHAS